jgi:hypothetical protein
MEYAARLTKVPSRQSLVAPLVALVLGAGVATGAYALIDEGSTTSSQVIVVQKPGPHAADIAGKNEATTAAAISQVRHQTTDTLGKDEASTAAAIGKQQSGGIELRGSKASQTGTFGGSAVDRAQQLRSEAHGPVPALH